MKLAGAPLFQDGYPVVRLRRAFGPVLASSRLAYLAHAIDWLRAHGGS
jgi:hypothetical protein